MLHIDSSIIESYSASRHLSAAVVAKLTNGRSDVSVSHQELAASRFPHLSGAFLTAAQASEAELAPDLKADLAQSSAVMQEFLAADIVVIGVAFVKFPTQLKVWINRILIAGQTFRYGSDGAPEGLVGDKRVILTIARWDVYSPGSPAHAYEHAESCLRAVFGLIVSNQRQAAIANAENQIAALAA